jgi:hypothetical protein
MATEQTSQGRPRWLPWALGGMTLLLIGCVVVIGLGLWFVRNAQFGTNPRDQLSQEEVERLIDAKLPPGASELHSHYIGFQDFFARVRFEIPATELPQFLASTAFTDPPSTIDNPFSPGEKEQDWWHPYEAQRFQWFERPQGSGRATLLIDMTNPDRYIVYWQGFST